MQTLKIDIEDSILDKIVWLLSNFDGVKIKKVEDNDECSIEYVDQSEEKEILQKLDQLPLSEKEIDSEATTVVSL